MIPEIRNGCLNCHNRYQVTEFDNRGNPLHVHYCNDCVKVCTHCGGLFLVTRFLADKKSNAYQEWAKSATENAGPLGLLTGRDAYLDKCLACQPFPDKSIVVTRKLTEEAPPIEEAEEDVFARLNRLIHSVGA